MENQDLVAAELKEAFWPRHIETRKDSGLNITEYCELEELKKSAFAYWRRKLTSRGVKKLVPCRNGSNTVKTTLLI